MRIFAYTKLIYKNHIRKYNKNTKMQQEKFKNCVSVTKLLKSLEIGEEVEITEQMANPYSVRMTMTTLKRRNGLVFCGTNKGIKSNGILVKRIA